MLNILCFIKQFSYLQNDQNYSAAINLYWKKSGESKVDKIGNPHTVSGNNRISVTLSTTINFIDFVIKSVIIFNNYFYKDFIYFICVAN